MMLKLQKLCHAEEDLSRLAVLVEADGALLQPEVAEGKKTLVWTTVMGQSAGTAAEVGSSSRPKLQSRCNVIIFR